MADKNVKDVLVALGDLGALVAGLAKDGIQASDAILLVDALIKNPQIIADVKEAIAGASEIPAEIKSLSFVDGVDLAQCAYDQVKKVLAASKI